MEVIKRAFSLVIVVVLTSCLKEEIPVGKPNPGDVEISQIEMSSDYKYQVYFDLNTGKEVSKNLKVEWDLGFECGVDGHRVILNSSKLMFAADSRGSDFSIKDTAGGYSWRADVASGNLDSIALINLKAGNVYIIDRGYNEKGKHQGFHKLSLQSVNESSYEIKIATLEETKTRAFTILKDDNQNFVNYSLNGIGEMKQVEPDKSSWDLCFTQYTESLFDSEVYIPYLVTGVLVNRNLTLTMLVEDVPFEQISLSDVTSGDYSDRIDGIGYSWKVYDFDLAQYTVNPNLIYIVKNRSGFFYKLRFVDFYNGSGENGSPKFEYQRL